MPYPYSYEGSPYLQQGSFNASLLGRMEYGPGISYGTGYPCRASPFVYSGFFGGSYPSPYSGGPGPYGTASKYCSMPSEHGGPALGRRLKGLSRLPSLKGTSNRLAVFHTENIDVTTPRRPAPPPPPPVVNNASKEITRERREGYDGTIRRGRTVIRMETEHLKDNPELEKGMTKKKPKKTVGQKLKEKYLVGSVKKRKHGGYRRPTLNDLHRGLSMEYESPSASDQSDGCQTADGTEDDDPYYKRVKDEPGDQRSTTLEDDDIACDQEIELIFQPPTASIPLSTCQTLEEEYEEPEIVTITLKPRMSLPSLAEEEPEGSSELPEDLNSIIHKMDSLEINTERRPSVEFNFTVPLPPRIEMETDTTGDDDEVRNSWISYSRVPENPDDFWARQSSGTTRRSISKKSCLKLVIPSVNTAQAHVQNLSPEVKESTSPVIDIWGDRSPTPTFYFRRNIDTILEKNESQEVNEGQEDEEEEDAFDFWGNEKRPSYHCMHRGLAQSRSPEEIQNGADSAWSRRTPDEKSGFDFWGNEKRPSYHRFHTSLQTRRSYGFHLTPMTPLSTSTSVTPLSTSTSLTSSPMTLAPEAHGSFFKGPSPPNLESVSKKSNDSGFFESAISDEKPILKVKPKQKEAQKLQSLTPEKVNVKWNKSELPSPVAPLVKPVLKTIKILTAEKSESQSLTSSFTPITKTEKVSNNAANLNKSQPQNVTLNAANLNKSTPQNVKNAVAQDVSNTQNCQVTTTAQTKIIDEVTVRVETTIETVQILESTQTEEDTQQVIDATNAAPPTTSASTFAQESTTILPAVEHVPISSLNLKNPRIESLKKAERHISESSSGCGSAETSTFDDDSPNLTPKSSMKEGSTSTSSSTLSAGTSSASSRRMPSPPSDYDTEDEGSSSSPSKGKLDPSSPPPSESLNRTASCPSKGRPKYRTYHLNDFQFLKVLGKGSFGKVLLAELKGSDSYYAIKCLKKDVVLEDDDVECTMIERKVLLIGSKHPYLCHLFCTFQSESHLFFAMEYLNGGDLMFHIQHDGRFSEERARFYGAEIVSGLKFLHKKGVIYRDLKLDNILLDYEGHVRIADFGMCKLQIFLDRTADTFCGTPDYMSPEIIKGVRYNQCVDYWAFGVLLYEMLVGQSPFSGSDEDELFWSICNEPVHFPRFLSRESKRILELLLEKDGYRRLGSPGSIYGDIKDIGFFTTIDWDRLERRELEPPFKPKLRDPLDVKYFDTTFTKEVARLTPVDKQILRSMDQSQFDGFSYTNPHTTD